jgi:hypothetical protein
MLLQLAAARPEGHGKFYFFVWRVGAVTCWKALFGNGGNMGTWICSSPHREETSKEGNRGPVGTSERVDLMITHLNTDPRGHIGVCSQ